MAKSNSRELERKCIKMQFLSVFQDIAKIANFWWKNADASSTQVVCHMIYLFSGFALANDGITMLSFINV